MPQAGPKIPNPPCLKVTAPRLPGGLSAVHAEEAATYPSTNPYAYLQIPGLKCFSSPVPFPLAPRPTTPTLHPRTPRPAAERFPGMRAC
jgi:hypothetical protein